jgi:hypothetical protein
VSRLLAIAAGLALLVACEHDEQPFENIVWGGQCSAAPRTFEVAFRAEDRVDESGQRRTYLGHVLLVVDGTGLEDHYLWQIRVDDDGGAETEWMQRAPIPDEIAEAWDLRPLALSARTFVDRGDSAEVTGTCTWDGQPGDLTLWMTDDCDACIDCATVGSPRGGALGAMLAAVAALVSRSRRRPRRR